MELALDLAVGARVGGGLLGVGQGVAEQREVGVEQDLVPEPWPWLGVYWGTCRRTLSRLLGSRWALTPAWSPASGTLLAGIRRGIEGKEGGQRDPAAGPCGRTSAVGGH